MSVDAKSQYRELPTDESLKSSKDRTRAAKILRDGPSGPQDQEWLTDYFKNYSFPRWTLAKNFQSISDFVKEWRQFVANAKGESHKTLLELTMTSMKDFVSDSEYSPAVRYNAILVIGLLNEQEPEGGRKSVLLPEALPILLENLKDPNQIDAVRVGALVGLVRHCQAIGSDPAGNPSVTRELLKIAKESDHAGRSPAGHAWMRVLAIDGLGALKQVGTANEVADALAAIVADKSAKINVRTAAVKALGGLNYAEGASGLKVKDLAVAVAQVAADATAAELRRKVETATPSLPGAGGMGMPGMRGPMGMGSGGMRGPMGMGSGGMRGPMGMGSGGMRGPMGMGSGGMRGPMGMGSGGMRGGAGMGPGAAAGADEEEKGDEAAENFRRRTKGPVAAVIGALGKKSSVANRPKTGLMSLAAANTEDEEFLVFLSGEVEPLSKALDDEKSVYTELVKKVRPMKDGLAAKLKKPMDEFRVWQQKKAEKEAAKTRKK